MCIILLVLILKVIKNTQMRVERINSIKFYKSYFINLNFYVKNSQILNYTLIMFYI